MKPSQEFTGKPRGRALAIAILALTVVGLAVFAFIGFPKNDFKSRFNKIQLDMTEDEVDELILGYPNNNRYDLIAIERELYGPRDGPCIRTPVFRKDYLEKQGATEGDHYIEVYFDDTYLVVGKNIGELIK